MMNTTRLPFAAWIMVEKCRGYFGADRAEFPDPVDNPNVVAAHGSGETRGALRFAPDGHFEEGVWNDRLIIFTVKS